MPLADIDGLSRDALDSLGPRGHCTARDARVWSLHTSGVLDWTRFVSCVCGGEGGLVALCEPSVCSCAFQSVNSARVVYKRAGGGAILSASGPGALYRRPSLSLSLLSIDSHNTFGGVRRAPSPLRRLRTSNNYNMQLVGRRRTRYAGVLGHLCSETRTVLLLWPRLQNSPDYKYIESCSWLPAGGGGSSGCRHRPQAPPAYMCMHMSYQA